MKQISIEINRVLMEPYIWKYDIRRPGTYMTTVIRKCYDY